MTVLQAAKVLGVSQQTVRRALKRGRQDGGMDAAQRCRRLKVSGAEVKRFWREH
ncbi:unknown [Prevotella sp. CAG:873]|nr:unknown [Prevotella sp. CAG:873]